MKTVTIEGYLVQDKLEDALREIVGADSWQGREVRLPVGRRRWDMSYKLNAQITVVDFDGDEHYRNTLKIKADEEKDRIAEEHGYPTDPPLPVDGARAMNVGDLCLGRELSAWLRFPQCAGEYRMPA